jgi:hypothetical protein
MRAQLRTQTPWVTHVLHSCRPSTHAPPSAYPLQVPHVTVQHLVDHFVNSARTDSLGIIANTWLAHADRWTGYAVCLCGACVRACVCVNVGGAYCGIKHGRRCD